MGSGDVREIGQVRVERRANELLGQLTVKASMRINPLKESKMESE